MALPPCQVKRIRHRGRENLPKATQLGGSEASLNLGCLIPVPAPLCPPPPSGKFSGQQRHLQEGPERWTLVGAEEGSQMWH